MNSHPDSFSFNIDQQLNEIRGAVTMLCRGSNNPQALSVWRYRADNLLHSHALSSAQFGELVRLIDTIDAGMQSGIAASA
jgi:hypothetical protein